MIVSSLYDQLLQVAPIEGVSIGRITDKTTWRIDFKPEATPQQRATAQQILDQFDVALQEEKSARIETRQRAAKVEAALASQFRTLTPQQAIDYIETNVTNVATTKAVLKIMARILIAMRDEIWPDMPE